MAADGIIPDRLIVSALEFAVGQALLGARQAPPQPYPAGLRKYLKDPRLKPKAWPVVREAIEADPAFRERVGARAHRDLVDEAGLLWLQRPKGWEQRLASLADGEVGGGASGSSAKGGGAAPSLAADLRASERRRAAAEEAAEAAYAARGAARRTVGMLSEVRAECVEAYRAAHAENEPGVRDLLAKHGLRQFRIFLAQLGDRYLEFATYEYAGEGEHQEALAALAAEPRNVEWQARCGPMQVQSGEAREGVGPWIVGEQIFFNA